MMRESVAKARQFWSTIAQHVTAKVEPALRQKQHAREPLIAYLRDLEALARRECESRDTIQIIASGRRILGDREQVGSTDGPFSRT